MRERSNQRETGIDHRVIPVREALGLVLAHDITEIRRGEFKGTALKKGHVVRREDITHLRRLGKEHLYVLKLDKDEMHEDEAAYTLAQALKGEGVSTEGPPNEGRINLIAEKSGLLRVNHEGLFRLNCLGEVMCATAHNNSLVSKGQKVAATRAIPLVIKKAIVRRAVTIAKQSGSIVRVDELRKPKVGVVITGNEVYRGLIRDAFAPIVTEKINAFQGEIVGIYYAPDDAGYIADRLRELIAAGADLLITTGGMSVDPDDVTRFAIRSLGVSDLSYGSAVLPGAMFLVAYLDATTEASMHIPVLGIPACGMFAKTTVFDLILPRVLSGEYIGRKELARMGHGGLCLNCKECRYPTCPFGKE